MPGHSFKLAQCHRLHRVGLLICSCDGSAPWLLQKGQIVPTENPIPAVDQQQGLGKCVMDTSLPGCGCMSRVGRRVTGPLHTAPGSPQANPQRWPQCSAILIITLHLSGHTAGLRLLSSKDLLMCRVCRRKLCHVNIVKFWQRVMKLNRREESRSDTPTILLSQGTSDWYLKVDKTPELFVYSLAGPSAQSTSSSHWFKLPINLWRLFRFFRTSFGTLLGVKLLL